ncbi:MAG: hypothetical protein M0027_00725 [Candidatus Dormibacteraeota bacterium]|nr:hypothetical protein [Candidatus Dormibacteraeota bacterium]
MIQLAVGQADHVAACPVSRDGNVESCRVGLAMRHTLAAAAEAARAEGRGG